MDTPICDYVRRYAANDPIRLHMPGHKGRAVLGPEAMDITEIPGADVLYDSAGIIRQSEENAAGLFGAARTIYSAEGSSLCIRAMLYLALLYAKSIGRRPLIAAGRNAHKVFVSAAALLDMDIQWLYPPKGSRSIISCPIDAHTLEETLRDAEDIPAAVYITSPDYLGECADIAALAEVCRRYGVLLLVDNAHGAYLRFLPRSVHPMDQGADLCCDSAHKTLPVLTGGAYLHFSHRCPPELISMGDQAMGLFASTSPSYLILQSLDLANRYLAGDYPRRLLETAGRVSDLRDSLRQNGWTISGQEPLKLTLCPKANGYTGEELAARLRGNNIFCEFSDPDFLVFMFTPETAPESYDLLRGVLLSTPRRAPIMQAPPMMDTPVQAISPRQALLSPRESVPTRESEGRILAVPNVSCPPAVPIVVCGERIDASAVRLLSYYGIESCEVVKGPPSFCY